jgi:hypothetical membrane protein
MKDMENRTASNKLWRYLCISGMVAVAAYVLHVVLGGFLWQGYNHLMQPISDLTATGAPDRALLNNILLAYAIPAVVFGLSAYIYLRRFAPKLAQVGMLLYLIMQAISFLYKFFPEDLPGAAMSFPGLMHMVITFAIVPLTILAPIFIGAGLRKLEKLKKFGIFCIVVGFVILCAGGTSTIFFANRLPYFGLVERINIGTLQLWTFLLALKLVRTETAKQPYKT